jgi:predicted house-cleaning noncanonical NTP pyrophosphatase (MazG superfamily)
MDFKHTDFPIELKLPKLIRDKIPQIIKKNEGREAIVRVAKDDEEFLHYVLKKLVEEVVEIRHCKTKDEFINDICDLEELIKHLMELKKIKRSEIERIKKIKIKKHGGFLKRLIFEGKK